MTVLKNETHLWKVKAAVTWGQPCPAIQRSWKAMISLRKPPWVPTSLRNSLVPRSRAVTSATTFSLIQGRQLAEASSDVCPTVICFKVLGGVFDGTTDDNFHSSAMP